MLFKAFKRNFAQLHQKFYKLQEKYFKDNHTTEHVDTPPLRYVSVMSNACIAFVLLVSLKR